MDTQPIGRLENDEAYLRGLANEALVLCTDEGRTWITEGSKVLEERAYLVLLRAAYYRWYDALVGASFALACALGEIERGLTADSAAEARHD